MIIKNHKSLRWFVKFGKWKANVLHFLLFVTLGWIINTILNLIFYKSNTGHWYSWNLFKPFIFLGAINSFKFYDDALKSIKDTEILEKKGLTVEDVQNIKFVKEWGELRGKGIVKYLIFDGAFVGGAMLFLPIACMWWFLKGPKGNPFKEFSDMMYFTLYSFLIGVAAGTILYWYRWTANERRFKRLTLYHLNL